MTAIKITEQLSAYRHLEKMSIDEITRSINDEDQKVALVVKACLPQINAVIHEVVSHLKNNGRLFYVGAGSGGRLSVLDVIEMPTTYGVEKGLFNTILAGGISQLANAPEEKEDDLLEGWEQLQLNQVNKRDMVIGISASGTTPFVLETFKRCRLQGIFTACVVSNPESEIAKHSDLCIEVITGPEFLTGSTRMKCGTAQKMIFDIISTTTMIQLGKVEDNLMVDVKLVNNKIIDRAARIVMMKTSITDIERAKNLLKQTGSIRKAVDALQAK